MDDSLSMRVVRSQITVRILRMAEVGLNVRSLENVCLCGECVVLFVHDYGHCFINRSVAYLFEE